MKYSILDVSQQAMVNNGLDVIDAVILTWFSDFVASGKMKWAEIDGKLYYWLFYQTCIDELPAIGITTRHGIQVRFDKYIQKGIIEKHISQVKGTFTYFRFTDKWNDEFKSSPLVAQECNRGLHDNAIGGCTKSSDKDSLQDYSLQKDSLQENNTVPAGQHEPKQQQEQEETKPKTDYQQIVDLYYKLFQDYSGRKPIIDAAFGAMVKDLLSKQSVTDIVAVMRAYFDPVNRNLWFMKGQQLNWKHFRLHYDAIPTSSTAEESFVDKARRELGGK